MKNSIKFKIFIALIALALLVGAIAGLTVSAESTTPVILSKNVKINGNFCLMFAVDTASVTGNEVTLTVYRENPDGMSAEEKAAATVQTITKSKTDATLEALGGDGVKDDSVIVFETLGVSAKDITDVWYVTAASEGAESDAITYSVREYAYERLYKDGKVEASDPDTLAYRQRSFYLKLLEIGAAAQELLVNFDSELGAPVETPEKLANAYTYASIKGGSFTELSASHGFVELGDTLTLTASIESGVTLWRVDTYSEDGTLTASEDVENGNSITVAGNTVVTAGLLYGGVTPGHYFDDYGKAYFSFENITADELIATDGELLTNYFRTNASHVGAEADTAGYYELVTDSETGNKYLRFTNPGQSENPKNSRTYIAFKSENIGGAAANCTVFEADMLVDTSYTTNRYIYFGAGKNTYDKLAFASPTGASSELSTYSYFTASTTADDADLTDWYPENKTAYSLEYGAWHRITIEIYDMTVADSEASTKTRIKLYVDGEFLWEYTKSTDTATEAVDSYMLILQDYFHQYDICLDNIFVGKIVKEYAAN